MVASYQTLKVSPIYREKQVWYITPIWKKVSWNEIAYNHVKHLKKYLNITLLDEEAFPNLTIFSNPLIILHPYFYPLQKWEKRIKRNLIKLRGLIGIDVADSDHLTNYAVRLTNYSKAIIVPSQKAKETYQRSGVTRDVYVVPHGVSTEWITTKPNEDPLLSQIAKLKETKNLKMILSFCIHSGYRKGIDLIAKIFAEVHKEIPNTALVLRDCYGIDVWTNPPTLRMLEVRAGASLTITKNWFSQNQKMLLFDLADVFLLGSRGGGFEHPALEAIARGIPTIGAEGGAWEDYMPKWMLVPSHKSQQVLAGNPIHDGCGVEMEIHKAVEKTIEFLTDKEYKQKTKDYVKNVIEKNFTWEKIALKLKNIITRYL